MGKVIIDADDLDQFAMQLDCFNRELSDQASKLRALFRQLGETWRDPAYGNFAQEFEETVKNLERFQRIADETIPKLRGKARRARDVHG